LPFQSLLFLKEFIFEKERQEMRFPVWTGTFFLSSLGGGHLVAAGIASDQFTFTTTATTTNQAPDSLEQQQNGLRYLRTSHTDEMMMMMMMDSMASTTAATVTFGTQLIRTIESTDSGAAVAIQSSVTAAKSMKKKDAATDWDALPRMEYHEDAIFWSRVLSQSGASMPPSSPTPAPTTPPPESCPVNVSVLL
jgi:hypothetical protein